MISKSYQMRWLRLSLIILFCLGTWLTIWPQSLTKLVLADATQAKFNQNIEAVKKRINETQVSLEGLSLEKITLEQAINELNDQVSDLRMIIADTEAEINRLQVEIDRLKIEVEVQINILKRVLVLLYQQSGASTLELIITADNFSDYLDNQEYLNRLQDGIAQSVNHIQKLEVDLASEQAIQVRLLEEQAAQELVLNAVLWETEQLLITTQNQESLFQAQLAELELEQVQLEQELQAYLTSLLQARVSLGSVKAGEVIGKSGNTGWSTGPHLHITIQSHHSVYYNPLDFLHSNNLIWPMGGNGGWVSQGFHSGHRALDIAAQEGLPIRAIADGDMIHRGCLFTNLGDYATFGIIIDHGNYVSTYLHLQAPNNPNYTQCSINRRSSYGTLSVDYSVQE